MEGIQSVATNLNTGLQVHYQNKMHEQIMKRIPDQQRSEYDGKKWVAEAWITISETSLTFIDRNLFCVFMTDELLICETQNDNAPLNIVQKVDMNTVYKLTKGMETSISMVMNQVSNEAYVLKFASSKARDDWFDYLNDTIKQKYNSNHANELKKLITTSRADKWKSRKTKAEPVLTSPTNDGNVLTRSYSTGVSTTREPISVSERQSRRQSVALSSLVKRRT
jgi:hypothetical protein